MKYYIQSHYPSQTCNDIFDFCLITESKVSGTEVQKQGSAGPSQNQQ